MQVRGPSTTLRMTTLIWSEQLLLPLFFVVNHGANFGAEFFSQLLHHGILFGAAATSNCRTARLATCTIALCRGCDGCARNNFQFNGTPEDATGARDSNAPGVRTQRHVHNCLRLCNFDY